MPDFVQLDLFGDRPDFDRPPNAVSLQRLLPQELSDEELIAAIPEVTLADACALAAEAGKRRLSAAIVVRHGFETPGWACSGGQG